MEKGIQVEKEITIKVAKEKATKEARILLVEPQKYKANISTDIVDIAGSMATNVPSAEHAPETWRTQETQMQTSVP